MLEMVNPVKSYENQAIEAENNDNPELAQFFYGKASQLLADKLGNVRSAKESDKIMSQIDRYDAAAKDCVSYKQTRKTSNSSESEPALDIVPTKSKITFDDVAGMESLKQKLIERIVWPVEDPDYFDYVDEKSTGAVLAGPPGCGKTYMVKALAGEAGVSYFDPHIGDIKNMYVGKSEEHLGSYFEAAAENAPSILFFDELDALGGVRSGRSKHSDELVNAFLQAFGIIEDKIVMVVGATNKPWNIDGALARSGRFSDSIYIPPPDHAARKEMFELYLNKKKPGNIDFEQLANLCKGYASSDIREISNIAGRAAYRRKRMDGIDAKIQQEDLRDAIVSAPSSLSAWAYQVRTQLIDNRYDDNRLKSKFDHKYMTYIEEADNILETLKGDEDGR